MTERQARHRFEKTCQALHAAGWDVLGVILNRQPGSIHSHARVLIHGNGLDRLAVINAALTYLDLPVPGLFGGDGADPEPLADDRAPDRFEFNGTTPSEKSA